MTKVRPLDLPDFARPPLTEVAIGVQFDSIANFLSPHLGLIWQRFRDEFPLLEEHPPLPPSFETFGPNPQFMPAINFQVLTGIQTPRAFFVDATRTRLLQIQKDRFLHNWRKAGEGDQYPRFERMVETFETNFLKYAAAVAAEGLSTPVPNQCEVTYINQIATSRDQSLSDLTHDLFGQHTGSLALDDLGKPEDLRFLLRYVLRDPSNNPIGRMMAVAEPAMLADGSIILQFTLTARGRPTSPEIGSVIEFLERGRMSIVRAFTHLTTKKMHEVWERTH